MQTRTKPAPLIAHWLILSAALLVLGAAGIFYFFEEQHRTQEREEERLLAQARVVQENVGQNLAAVDAALVDVRNQLPTLGAGRELDLYLKTLTDAMPAIRTVAVLDAQGNVTGASRKELANQNMRQRAFFDEARRSRDPDILFVSPPFRTSLDVYTIVVTKVLADVRGGFAGLVLATLDPNYFAPLLESIRYTPDTMTSIVHWSGTRFLVRPDQGNTATMNLRQPGTFFTVHREGGRAATVYSGRVYATGDERMIAQRTVMPAGLKLDQPMVVAVSRRLDLIYATLYRDIRILSALYGAMALLSIAGLYAYQRKHLESAAREAEAFRVVAANERFMKMIADHLPGMVAYWTDELRCRFSNAAYLEWFGKTPEQMRDIRIQDLMGPELFAKNEPYMRAALRGEPQLFERTLTKPDGSIGHTLAQYIPDKDGDRVKGFVVLVSDVTKLKQAELELERLAQTDFLTGVANRRQFLLLAGQELSHAARYGGPLSVLMVDIDHFKKINDTYGHKSGDIVLQTFAALFRNATRAVDVIGRLGGEEFAAVLPQTDGERAREVATRLLEAVSSAEVRLDDGRTVRFTVSIGLASRARPDDTIDSMLGRADAALYEAKNTGRNRICAAEGMRE
ncbi:MAG TPA: diguanylate cyclase [Noviherbaspirillum sp.]|uniref:diguanylate cyclase n=1 Tax=Noviherbaspirillum sp. TaxID=1926288 RepID=UPI002B49F93B|nr:diguanylate cyclase [Noviherbaspirillum sp.]HJV87648.1 diguanylate cyclase [Noviherbaspirillum sp.]